MALIKLIKYILISVLLVGTMGCYQGIEGFEKEWIREPYPETQFTVQKFDSCEEIKQSYLEQIYKRAEYKRLYSPPGGLMIPMNSEASPTTGLPSNDSTNIQELGVGEVDYVKHSSSQIFVSRKGGIEVLNRHSLESIGEIELPNLERTQLILFENKLVVFGTAFQPNDNYISQTSIVSEDQPIYYNVTSYMKVYELSNNKLPKILNEQKYKGRFQQIRQVDQQVYLLFNEPLSSHNINEEEGAAKGVPCESVYKKNRLDDSYSFTRLFQYNLETQQQKSMGILGDMSDFYMTSKNMYIVDDYPQSFSGYGFDKNKEIFIIKKISFNNDELKLQAVGEGKGYVKDTWAFKEFGESLALVTTENSNPRKNHLWIFKSNDHNELQEVGGYHGFAEREDIRAIRYIGNKAYVVTFEKTDPLFVFDLENLESPKLLGELKVPGFSLYLHPVNNDLLMGVGYDAVDMGEFSLFQGIQVSLFDISNDENPQRVDVKIHGQRGSSSLVNSDHHAFYYNSDHNLATIPMIEVDRDGYRTASGVAVYEIEDSTLNLVSYVTHEDLIQDQNCFNSPSWRWWTHSAYTPDVERAFILDNKLLSFSQSGVKAHNLNNFKEIKSNKFKRRVMVCLR